MNRDVAAEGPPPDPRPDEVVHVVAQERGEDEKRSQDPHVETAQAGDGPRGEQQRVTRQERRHHQSRLAEDDEEQDQVGPGPVLRDDLGKVLVEMQEKVDGLLQELHPSSVC